MIRRLVLATVLLAVALAGRMRYDGYQVFRVVPTELQLKMLHSFRGDPGFMFWGNGRRALQPLNIMVSPTHASKFQRFLDIWKMQYELIISDLETVFEAERQRQMKPFDMTRDSIFSKFLTNEEINSYLAGLATSYPDLVTVESIGNSYEGRPINMIKISSGEDANRPVILVDAGIHAREWIAPAMALYIINQLVESGNHKDLYASVDWHIIPVLNPDGYNYTHTEDRMWRKNRSKNNGSVCIGVDQNRNFGFHWMEGGASPYPCDEEYAGSQAFSESETAALRDYGLSYKGRIKLYLTFHSFGNEILYPWGYTHDLPEDWKTLDDLAKAANSAQMSAGGDSYEIGSSTNVLYIAAGGSDDWMKGVAGSPLSYTVELPGGENMGFDPPAEDILPIVQEFFPAVRVFGEYVIKNN